MKRDIYLSSEHLGCVVSSFENLRGLERALARGKNNHHEHKLAIYVNITRGLNSPVSPITVLTISRWPRGPMVTRTSGTKNVTEPITSLLSLVFILDFKWTNMEFGSVCTNSRSGPYILTFPSKSPFNLKKCLMLGCDTERGLTTAEEIADTDWDIPW